jgi:hypothetical protein
MASSPEPTHKFEKGRRRWDGSYADRCACCGEGENHPNHVCGCGHPIKDCAPERCSHAFAHNALGLGDEA